MSLLIAWPCMLRKPKKENCGDIKKRWTFRRCSKCGRVDPLGSFRACARVKVGGTFYYGERWSVLDALGRVRDMVLDALIDLSPEQLLAPPKPHIAWLVWHIARVQDANFSNLMELPQLWIAGRWHERFNMPPDPRDYGSGHRHTQAQVDAFAVTDKQLLMDY